MKIVLEINTVTQQEYRELILAGKTKKAHYIMQHQLKRQALLRMDMEIHNDIYEFTNK